MNLLDFQKFKDVRQIYQQPGGDSVKDISDNHYSTYIMLFIYLDNWDSLRNFVEPNHLTCKGFEKKPHITIASSLHRDIAIIKDVKKQIKADMNIIADSIQFTGISAFENDVDVLKVDVESELLHEINDRLMKNKNQTTFKYTPHLTIAYLQKGTAKQYVNDKTFVDAVMELVSQPKKYYIVHSHDYRDIILT